MDYLNRIPNVYLGAASIAISIGCWIGAIYAAARGEREMKSEYEDTSSGPLEITFKVFDGLEQRIHHKLQDKYRYSKDIWKEKL